MEDGPPIYITKNITLQSCESLHKGSIIYSGGVHLPYWDPWVFVFNNHHIEIKLYLVELTSTTRAKIMLETP